MIAWITGIVFLLVISLFISDETLEPFVYKPPTVVPTKVRKDLTCSDPESSSIFDRYDKSTYMESLGSNLPIPVNMRTNNLLVGTVDYIATYSEYLSFPERRTALSEICNGLQDKTHRDYKEKGGKKVFYETNTTVKGGDYKLVDVYCCKGETYQPPGTSSSNDIVCLADCPSDYTKSSIDPTICIRNDNNCTYTSDLSANIQNNWFKTCSALYKQNTNITSTINSISNVVSTFTKQRDTVKDNYLGLNSFINAYATANSGTSDSTKIDRINNYTNNFGNITTEYNKLNLIQTTIKGKYDTLQADKVKFDTLFNKLACSNFM